MQSHLTTKKEKIMRLFGKRNHQFYANNCWFIIDEDVNLSFLIMLKLHRNEVFSLLSFAFQSCYSASLVGKGSNMVFSLVLLISLRKYFFSLYSNHENIVTTIKEYLECIWGVLPFKKHNFREIVKCIGKFSWWNK